MKQEQVDMKKNQYWSDQSHESPLGMGDPSYICCIFQLSASLCYSI